MATTPPPPTDQQVNDARSAAREADAAARMVEADGRRLRRQADALHAHYEHLLLMQQGQLPLFQEDP